VGDVDEREGRAGHHMQDPQGPAERRSGRDLHEVPGGDQRQGQQAGADPGTPARVGTSVEKAPDDVLARDKAQGENDERHDQNMDGPRRRDRYS